MQSTRLVIGLIWRFQEEPIRSSRFRMKLCPSSSLVYRNFDTLSATFCLRF